MLMDREGTQAIKAMAADALNKDPNALPQDIPEEIDWDLALKTGNRWYDRMVAALREVNPDIRKKKLEQTNEDLDAYLKAQKSKLATPQGQARVLAGGTKGVGKAIGDVLIGLVVPSMHKVQKAWDRVQQVQDNLHLAFALAWYQRDHGQYPKKLDELAPKYLRRIPVDIFSGKGLIYRPNGKGYLLYSVGANGKDEGGRGLDDDPPGDDLSVRIPLSAMPGK
jgi:hypothetical protein